MEQGILIYKNIHEVYGAVEGSLRKALKLKGPLLDQESIYHMPSLIRKYNYLLFSLPVLSSGAKKKLQRKLQSLKQMLEGEKK